MVIAEALPIPNVSVVAKTGKLGTPQAPSARFFFQSKRRKKGKAHSNCPFYSQTEDDVLYLLRVYY